MQTRANPVFVIEEEPMIRCLSTGLLPLSKGAFSVEMKLFSFHNFLVAGNFVFDK